MNTILSVGIPVYNRARFIEESVDSVLTQTFSDFELIISDNRSTDRSPQICEMYAQKDPRIRFLQQSENIGAARNFNFLFKESSGKYFKWAASDDLLDREYLDLCIGVLERDPSVVLAYAKSAFIDAEGNSLDVRDGRWNVTSNSAFERLCEVISYEYSCNLMFGVFRSSALAKTRLIGNYPGGDYRLLADLAAIGKFHQIPSLLYRRRLHSTSSGPWREAHPASSAQHSFAGMVSFYLPNQKFPIVFPFIQRTVDHILTVASSDMPVREKIILTRLIFLRLRWGRRRIFSEFRELLTLFAARIGAEFRKGS